jgi:hypothetical protein
MTGRRVVMKGGRTVRTYAYLRESAALALEQAEEKEDGSFYNCLNSIVMSAFCIEAYLNHLGETEFSYGDSDERLSTLEKLNIVASNLNNAGSYAHGHFQIIKEIMKIRDAVAHGRTITLEAQFRKPYEKRTAIKHPELFREQRCITDMAERYLRSVENVIRQLHRQAGFEDDPFEGISDAFYTVKDDPNVPQKPA